MSQENLDIVKAFTSRFEHAPRPRSSGTRGGRLTRRWEQG